MTYKAAVSFMMFGTVYGGHKASASWIVTHKWTRMWHTSNAWKYQYQVKDTFWRINRGYPRIFRQIQSVTMIMSCQLKKGFAKYPIVIWIVINKKHWESAELRQDLLCYTAPGTSHQEGREAVKGRLESCCYHKKKNKQTNKRLRK